MGTVDFMFVKISYKVPVQKFKKQEVICRSYSYFRKQQKTVITVTLCMYVYDLENMTSH